MYREIRTIFDMAAQKEKCTICLEDIEYSKTNTYSVTPCFHKYHKECINTWIESKRYEYKIPCPLCKSDISNLIQRNEWEVFEPDMSIEEINRRIEWLENGRPQEEKKIRRRAPDIFNTLSINMIDMSYSVPPTGFRNLISTNRSNLSREITIQPLLQNSNIRQLNQSAANNDLTEITAEVVINTTLPQSLIQKIFEARRSLR